MNESYYYVKVTALLLNQSAFSQSANSSFVLNPQSFKAEASPMTTALYQPQFKAKN